jgi:Flp pilus assembly protein TadG
MSFNKNPKNAPLFSSPLGFNIINQSQAVDASANTFAHHNASGAGTSAGTEIDYHFIDPLGANTQKVYITEIRFKKDRTDRGRVTINGTHFEANWADSGEEVYVSVLVNRRFTSLNTLTLFLETKGTTTVEAKLYRVQIFGYFNENFEFNDSVLSTKAWNSSRYDGKQLSATTINEFNTGDISYGGAPVMRNNTRTFYLASDIIPLDADENNNLADPTLPFIRDFSFAIINEAITINSDDTITSFNIGNINTISQLTGFQRYFQQNIPIKSEINLIPLDAAITNKTQNQYSVFYNEGLLRGIIDFVHGDFSNETVSTGGQDFAYTTASADGRHPQFRVRGPSLPSGDNSGGVTIVKDTKFMRSILGVNTPFSVFEGSAGGVALNAFFANALLSSDNDPSQTKFYLSFATTSSFSSSLSKNGEEVQLEVINKNSDGRESTLGGLSTVKLISDGPDFGGVGFIGGIGEISCSKFDFEESDINYSIPDRLDTEGLPAINPGCHGYTLSKLDNNKPALLINLNRRELPEGIGNKPVIIVPQNLHPFIKDNLTYFSAKAGLDIGDRKIVPELNETNRNLP